MLSKYFKVKPDTHVQDVLSHIQFFCHQCAMCDVRRNAILIIASEIINNIIKYADQGDVQVTITQQQVVIVARDVGIGMTMPLEEAFMDSRSASGSLGLGLSGIMRLSDDVQFCATPEGVRVTCTVNIHD